LCAKHAEKEVCKAARARPRRAGRRAIASCQKML
jgi:hypothetical protein